MVISHGNVFDQSSDDDEEEAADVTVAAPVKKMPPVIHEDASLASVDYLDFTLDEPLPDPDTTRNATSANDANLDKSILSNDSIGLRMMQRMGFDPSSKPVNEPIRVMPKLDKRGIGAKYFAGSLPLKDNTGAYRDRQTGRNRVVDKKYTIAKLKRLCYEMSGDADAVAGGLPAEKVDIMWRDLAAKDQGVGSIGGDEPIEDDEKVVMLLSYLANICHYCYYCGEQFANNEELGKGCAGLLESDHNGV